MAGIEFQSLEGIRITDLAKALVQFLSNLKAKGCGALENRMSLTKRTLGGLLISARLNKHYGSISIGKGQKRPYGEPGKQVS